MFAYIAHYPLYITICAVILPIIYSTVYPLITGSMAASSFSGLLTLFFLFVIGLMVGSTFFEKKARAIADGYIALYNEKCNPRAFIEQGSQIAGAMNVPFNQIASWYMSYYGQAELDAGNIDNAKKIYSEIVESKDKASKPIEKLAIISNLIPLAEKIDGPTSSVEYIDEGLDVASQCRPVDAIRYKDYLNSQYEIQQARISHNFDKTSQLDNAVWNSNAYPMRVRVEYAWHAAAADFKLNNIEDERKALEFVVQNGGELAFVSKAKARLTSI